MTHDNFQHYLIFENKLKQATISQNFDELETLQPFKDSLYPDSACHYKV